MTGPGPNPLTTLLPEIRERLAAISASCAWPDLEEQIARHLTRTRLPVHVLLPVASAAAVGGDPRRALSTAAACALLIVSMRWFDDLEDRDRGGSLWQEVGTARAINLAAAALTISWSALAEDEDLPRAALRAFGDLTRELARGQDADLRTGTVRSLDDYWRLMEGKTGSALALGCRVGALAARPEAEGAARACGRFGNHMGVAMQILDDLDGVFHPDGRGDLAAGKVTLPLLYGLSLEHPARADLAPTVAEGRLAGDHDRVRALLDTTDAREFLVWAAFEERQRGLSALDELPAPTTGTARAGRDALAAFADALLADWEDLLVRPSDVETLAAGSERRAELPAPARRPRLWPRPATEELSAGRRDYFRSAGRRAPPRPADAGVAPRRRAAETTPRRDGS